MALFAYFCLAHGSGHLAAMPKTAAMRHIIIYSLCALLLAACTGKKKSSMDGTEVLIETSMGNIRVLLYDDTPLHRDNFIKLAREGAYNQILFHRVVKDFMVQTGDPAIKPQGVAPVADTAAYRYTLPAEIHCPRHFHKKGAVAAARMPDSVNPDKESSGTQFYIVTGRTYKPGELVELYSAIYQSRIDTVYEQLTHAHIKELYLMRKQGRTDELNALRDELMTQAEAAVAANPPQQFGEAQKKAYTTVGGTPHLDGEYTVFGEVIEGIGVAEEIARTRTRRERPLQEIVVRKVSVME